MKETPKYLISFYRPPTPVAEHRAARVTYQAPPTTPTLPERISHAVESLKIWTLIVGALWLFWSGFNSASVWADHWFRDTEAAREAEVGKDMSALRAYYEVTGYPVIGRRYEVTELRRYHLPTSVTFRGFINSPDELPRENNQIGDFYKTTNNLWVWALDPKTLIPAWIDP
jgi:hypothetical protein